MRNEETQEIDLGNAKGVEIKNISGMDVKVYFDYRLPSGQWSAIFGELTIKPDGTLYKSKSDINHEHIRIGAKGEGGGYIVSVKY